MALTAASGHTAECYQDAALLLGRNHIRFQSIVRVDIDAILYVDRNDRAMTAWLDRRPGGVRIVCETGFAAERTVSFLGE